MQIFYCLFEQSGTFKKEFIKLGHKAYDFDILNEYGETDVVVDLFDEVNIENIILSARRNNATLLMFFPCTYFSEQQILWTRGNNYSQKKWTVSEKLQLSRRIVDETSKYYRVLCLWLERCIQENVRLVIENPYSESSYLVRYLPVRPTIIDRDRRRWGDKFRKPTMYYFINCSPKDHFEMLYPTLFDEAKIVEVSTRERSEISSNYAKVFIKTFLL